MKNESLLLDDNLNDWLHEPLSTFRVIVHHGVTIKPKWYDFPRRFGWRAKKRDAIINMRGNEVVIDKPNRIIYCTPAMEQKLRHALPEHNFIALE
jgi:hypothetical protein